MVRIALQILTEEPGNETGMRLALRHGCRAFAETGPDMTGYDAVNSLAWSILDDRDAASGLTRSAVSAIRLFEDAPNPRLDQAIAARLDHGPDPYLAIEQQMLAGDPDGAIAAARKSFRDGLIAKDDLALWRRVARALLVRGDIGRDAALLLAACAALPDEDRVCQQIDWIEAALSASGTSLAALARSCGSAPPYAHSATALAAAHIARHQDQADRDSRRGVVMLGGSLACGGAERIMANCYRRFRERGDLDPVQLWLINFTSKPGGPDYRFYLDESGAEANDIVEVTGTAVRTVHPALRAAPNLYAQRGTAIVEMLERERPAVLHCWLDQCCLIGAMAGLIARVPRILLHTHGLRPTSNGPPQLAIGWGDAYRELLHRPEITLINCADAGLSDYARWIEAEPGAKMTVIRNGIELEPFRSLPQRRARQEARATFGIPRGAPVIGTAFRFAPVKQPELWLDAAARIRDQRPDTHFILFGDGELRGQCRERALSLGFGDQIHMPGEVHDLPRHLPMLDLFMLSSASEGLPNVVIEAQAARVPVIAFDVGGVGEAVIQGKSAQLVGDHSAEALADAALDWLAKPVKRWRAGHIGRRFVFRQFGMDKMVDRLVAEMAA